MLEVTRRVFIAESSLDPITPTSTFHGCSTKSDRQAQMVNNFREDKEISGKLNNIVLMKKGMSL